MNINKNQYLKISFEPEWGFPHKGTDLLPFGLWPKYWNELKEELKELLQYPSLFDTKQIRIKRLDIGFDFFVDDPNKFIESVEDLPLDKRTNLEKDSKCRKDYQLFKTKNRAAATVRYNRIDKNDGYSVVRFEFRRFRQKKSGIRIGLTGLPLETPGDLENKIVLIKFLKKILHYNGIFPKVRILPKYNSKKYSYGKTPYKIPYYGGTKLKDLKGYREIVRRLIELNLVIGTNNTLGDNIYNLREAMDRAVIRSLKSQ